MIKMLNSTTTCTGIPGAETCTTLYAESTSTDPTIVNGFTEGEIVIATILFMVLTVLMALTYHVLFRRIKIKNQ